jgi:oligopeptidase B
VEVILDQNKLAEGLEFSELGVFEVSPNHELLAYSHDIVGDEDYTIYIKNLKTSELLADQIPNTYYSLEWANDSQTFFYTIIDEAHRPYKVLRHRIGDTGPDVEVFHEKDERFNVGTLPKEAKSLSCLSFVCFT